jgi:hypothetical protein
MCQKIYTSIIFGQMGVLGIFIWSISQCKEPKQMIVLTILLL